MIMVSACLFGVNCKYNGRNNYRQHLYSRLKGEEIALFCPEQLGGLKTPRLPSEIKGGTGQDVLDGTIQVISSKGSDLTAEFILGANETAKLAGRMRPSLVICKSNSPSCGVGRIYDGTFSECLRPGDGVASALLKKAGFTVITDNEFLSQGRN